MKNRLSIGAMVFLAVLIVVGMLVSPNVSDQAVASNESNRLPINTRVLASDEIPPSPNGTASAYYAKYEGIDGESKDENHDKWIDVLSIDWGAQRPGAGATGQSRRRGSAVVEDMTIALVYEKSAPKLQEKCLKGEIIPKLEIELTNERDDVYLKYELKNVLITSFHESGSAEIGPPTVVIGNNFEEIKITYTEYDDTGNPTGGKAETSWKVEKGAK
jgi:type VI secretion system secreted protein Hcp